MVRTRPNGIPKVTGQLSYLTDRTFSTMLYGKILRSQYPHALIKRISIDKAKALPGVRAVLTHEDVPGVNGYGIIVPDQPVFCSDRVLYIGDAIAAVAADTIAIAEEALHFIEVEYEELPVLDTPEKSLTSEAPLLYPDGNVLHKATHQKGDVSAGFSASTCMVKETYDVPRQMHTYMETEGGVIVPETDGGITVYMGTQHGFKDRFQLSRILAIDEEKIHVVSSPMGGSFGGKDELNVQPYAALLALKTACPVKIHQTRKESMISGIKRHPMKMKTRTGADEYGRILAHEVEIIADTGPYSTLGPAILDFAVEHAVGPYRIPHVFVDGKSVYTNNAVSGEFRGFGGNQITFALEGQMDRLAEKLGIEPLELRERNLRKENDLGPLEQRIVPTDGARAVVKAIKHASEPIINQASRKRMGTGIAVTMHGGGLGYGRLDQSGGRIALTNEGKIAVSFGFEEVGQGIIHVIETMATDAFDCSAEDLLIQIGDTRTTPSTGSTTASRGTSMVWNAINRLKPPFVAALTEQAGKLLQIEADKLQLGPNGIYHRGQKQMDFNELAASFNKEIPVQFDTSFDFPTTPDRTDGGHYLYTYAAVFAQVEVDEMTGRIAVRQLKQAISAGPVVNLVGFNGQIEGGGVMALGYTLMEDAKMINGQYITENLDTYLIPSIRDVPPHLEVEPIEELPEEDCFGPRGVGEIGTVAVAPAIAKAIHDATGLWVTKLPVSPETVLKALDQRSERRWKKDVDLLSSLNAQSITRQ